MLFLQFECAFFDLCGSGTPRCGGFMLGFSVWSPLECFCSLWATFVQHCATLIKYRTPIERMSYDTIKYRTLLQIMSYDTLLYRTHYWWSIVRHWKSITRLHEKYRAILIQYRTPSCKVSHSVREKYRPPLEKVSHGFGKNLRVPTAGSFCHVLIFSRIVLDTLLGVLQAYVVAFFIQ